MKYSILSNRDSFTYEDYVDYCNDMCKEPAADNSYEFYEWCAEMAQEYYICDRMNIACSKMNEGQFLITGILGRWDGKHSVTSSKTYDSLLDAIDACIPDCDFYIDVEWEDGIINVRTSYHDGSSSFEIHLLSKKGEKAAESADYWCKDYNPKPYWYKKIQYAM